MARPAKWYRVDYDIGFVAVDTANLRFTPLPIVTTRMKLYEGRADLNTDRGSNLTMDFDCYRMRWRAHPNERARSQDVRAGQWYSLSHNVFGIRAGEWRRFGEMHGDFPFSLVCYQAGLIDERGDYIGPRR